MSSAALSPSLRSLFSELEQLFQTETEARVSTSVRAAQRDFAEHLNQTVRRLRQADGFSDIAAILCEASGRFSKAGAVFRIHDTVVSGERVRGTREGTANIRELQFLLAEAAAFTSAFESKEPVVAMCSAAEISAALVEFFGHQPGDRAHLFPLTVDQITVGVLYTTTVVESAALELLTQAAAAVLEARRPPVHQEAMVQSPDLVHIEPASPPAPVPAGNRDGLSAADRSLHLRAQRFARVQVAEIRLYQADAVKSGRARGDLYCVLQDSIDSARDAFRQAFVSTDPTMTDYFHLELVRTLANNNPAWLGEKYPGPLA